MKLTKYRLFLLAALAWMIAGSMVMKVGFEALFSTHSYLLLFPATIIFYLFYEFVFSRLVKKHHKRIMYRDDDKLYWWLFFDKKSYIIMFCMMSFGILLRKSHLLPPEFFAFFYTGLGFALFSCGTRFFVVFLRERRRLYA